MVQLITCKKFMNGCTTVVLVLIREYICCFWCHCFGTACNDLNYFVILNLFAIQELFRIIQCYCTTSHSF